MATQMRLLFGIRTNATVSLAVTTNHPLPGPPPDLHIKTGPHDAAVACSDTTWAMTLGAGEHVICLPVANDRWFDLRFAFTLGAPATIVGFQEPTSSTLVSWTATGGLIDPKNPGPPPLKSELSPLGEATWFWTTLTSLRGPISVTRSAPEPVATAGADQLGPRR